MDIKIAQQETITGLVLENQKLKQERDDAEVNAAQLADRLSGLELRTTEELAKLERERNEWSVMCGRYKQERDETQKNLSSIHQWIERNHPDGFIDSLTYLQNLDRVTDNWYDRFDRLEVDACRFVRERDEAREIIRMAKAKFCEEGSDGNIASEIFSILGNINCK